MRVLITGASGFLGTHLVAALRERGTLAGRDGRPAAIARIVALDVVAARPVDDPRIEALVGDASDPAVLAHAMRDGIDAVFALGATLTSDAEADFGHGYAVNLHGMLHLLERCRLSVRVPRLVFTSSIAAFGGPLPETVDDDLPRTPQTSYGTQKAIDELLIHDYARHGFVDGRCLRLPIVVVRPGAPVASVSDRLASLVREPLNGRDAACPWRPQTRVTVASARAATRALIALHDVPAAAFGHTRSVNLPAVSVTVDGIVQAARALAGRRAIAPLGQVDWRPDAGMQALVDGWPRHFVSTRAATLGIEGDASIDAIVAHYADDHLAAAAT